MNAYESAGVNIAAGAAVVDELQKNLKTQSHVLGSLGTFAGCYDLGQEDLTAPVLVSGTDGVGTKVLLAAASGKLTTIGQDLVAMCVNDVVAQGAKPLFFLDYLAVSHLEPTQVQQVLQGVLAACQAENMALLGGETAEMPGVYQGNHFDLAGFAVGLAQKQTILQAKNVQAGDVLLGLPSSGLHSNGFSLVRKILFEDHDYQLTDLVVPLEKTLQDELLTPTRLYSHVLQPLLQQQLIAGAAHITGGGLLDNVPRILPDTLQAEFDPATWPELPIFALLRQLGGLTPTDCYETFNMGLGMVLAIHPDDLAQVEAELQAQQAPYYRVGQVTPRLTQAVVIKGVAHD